LQQRPIALGAAAPDFELEAHTGERVRLSAGRGASSLVLYFMRAFT
jgi:peroxiredoxin